MTETAFAPLTPGLWPAFEDLFGAQGACGGCWCVAFLLPPAARRANGAAASRAFMRARVEAGPPPGVLALEAGKATGWLRIGPRADVPEWNNRRRASAPLDDAPAEDRAVWAASCFFLRRSARRRGLTHALLAAGVALARANGARLLEACPLERSKSRSSPGLFVGPSETFRRAGFAVVAERRPGRPLMRLVL